MDSALREVTPHIYRRHNPSLIPVWGLVGAAIVGFAGAATVRPLTVLGIFGAFGCVVYLIQLGDGFGQRYWFSNEEQLCRTWGRGKRVEVVNRADLGACRYHALTVTGTRSVALHGFALMKRDPTGYPALAMVIETSRWAGSEGKDFFAAFEGWLAKGTVSMDEKTKERLESLREM